ncbi:sulfatase-like hydrolase/transferase [Candidatus Saccharibacteria bacterium]|nr:sulfatase-like hydrolase/transferase [Candidatus Saccharibacteria bacterium]
MLPPLDGTEFDWGSVVANIVSIVVVIALVAGMIVLIRKLKPKKTATIINYVNLAIIAMLAVSFVTTIATTDVFKAKEVATEASATNINLVSNNENYFILMLDAVDAKTFEAAMEEDGAEELKDFTFFPDSLSGYPFTRDSLPFIFSGIWNENEKPFAEYSTEAFDNAKFFSELSQANYSVKNFYDEELIWESRKAFDFNNIESVDKAIKTKHFLTQEVKYLLFKTLPFPLKRYSKIDKMDFNMSKVETTYEKFAWDDIKFYHETLKKPAEKTDEKVFSFIHLEGSHVPLNLDKNVELVDGGTSYYSKVRASLTVAKGFINYLKKSGAYNNASIVILADHGYDADGKVQGRQNPLLMTKGIGETHSKMHTSSKQVSFADLAEMFKDLLGGKNSAELFSGIEEDGRVRRYLYYVFNYEDHMVEQTLNGKAWETEKMTPTGKEYNL